MSFVLDVAEKMTKSDSLGSVLIIKPKSKAADLRLKNGTQLFWGKNLKDGMRNFLN